MQRGIGLDPAGFRTSRVKVNGPSGGLRSHPRGRGADRRLEGAGSDRVWGVSYRLKLPRLAGLAAGSHGAGGAVVAGTAGCRYSPGPSVQGNLDARTFPRVLGVSRQ